MSKLTSIKHRPTLWVYRQKGQPTALSWDGPPSDAYKGFIEFSKYEELEELFKDAVLSAISQFHIRDPKTGEWYYDSMCMSDGEYYLPLAIERGYIQKEEVRRI